MIPSKAYILRINTDISKQYAKTASDSCEEVGLPWEYFEGYTVDDIKKMNIPKDFPVKGNKINFNGKGGACTAGHIHIWKMIADNNECAVILEHDALMLHKPEIEIPDNMIVALGYKVKDPDNYDHKKAGAPTKIENRAKHGGAHAYAINHITAKSLIKSIEKNGTRGMVDNAYFLRNSRPENIKLGISEPTCAIGWLRNSTIWPKSAVDNYRPLLDSFKNNYHSKQDLGLKN